MQRTYRKTSRNGSVANDLPPWEQDPERLTVMISVDAYDRMMRIADRAGVKRGYVIDALLRSMPDDELHRIIEHMKEGDGAARAAWQRGGS